MDDPSAEVRLDLLRATLSFVRQQFSDQEEACASIAAAALTVLSGLPMI
jgi:hypothetical protein